MWFSKRLSTTHLVGLCHILRHSVEAGIPLTKVFRLQAERGPAAVKPVASRISAHLERGDNLAHALKDERHTFPPLFLSLAVTGEQTGSLPEVFRELEEYFTLQQKLNRDFWSQAFGPLVQWAFAVVVIVVVMVIVESLGGKGPTMFGVGGAAGAALFVAANLAVVLAIVLGYVLVTRTLGGAGRAQRMLLATPMVGPCLRALALGRFALASSLTMEAGLSPGRALRQSLAATGNAAFAAKAEQVVAVVKQGDDLTLALTTTGLFPVDFLALFAVAEEAGRVPEVMRQQAEVQNEEAARRLKSLTRLAAGVVWLAYVIFMVVMIFQMYAVYFSALGLR